MFKNIFSKKVTILIKDKLLYTQLKTLANKSGLSLDIFIVKLIEVYVYNINKGASEPIIIHSEALKSVELPRPKSVKELAKQFGVSRSFIYNLIKKKLKNKLKTHICYNESNIMHIEIAGQRILKEYFQKSERHNKNAELKSKRVKKTLELKKAGMSTTDIANKLNLSRTTINNYLNESKAKQVNVFDFINKNSKF